MEYKQIVNYPLYYITKDGKNVAKLCKQEYYKKIGDDIYRSKKPYKNYCFLMPRDLYFELNGLIFRRIKLATNQFGYKFVKLVNSSGQKTLYIHRLMYRTFVGVIPSGMEINHIDHNKENNCIDNLELLTHNENMQKAVLHYGNKLKPRCKCCGKVIYTKTFETVYCLDCMKKRKMNIPCYTKEHKYKHPSKNVLWNMIKTMTFVEIGKIYSVTDNSIRKLAKSYGLPYRKRDIERQIEKENLLLDSRCIGES